VTRGQSLRSKAVMQYDCIISHYIINIVIIIIIMWTREAGGTQDPRVGPCAADDATFNS